MVAPLACDRRISPQKCGDGTEKGRLGILFPSCWYSRIDDLVRVRLPSLMTWALSSGWCSKRWRSYWQWWDTRSLAEHAPIRSLKQLSFCSPELWLGNRVNSNTVSGNIDNLRQLERLSNVWEHLSPSIKVPSRSTRSLSQRYVWIDSLCILQDNARNSKVNINAMHSAYQQVLLLNPVGWSRTSNLRSGLLCCWLCYWSQVKFWKSYLVQLTLIWGSEQIARSLLIQCSSSYQFFKQGYYDAAV